VEGASGGAELRASGRRAQSPVFRPSSCAHQEVAGRGYWMRKDECYPHALLKQPPGTQSSCPLSHRAELVRLPGCYKNHITGDMLKTNRVSHCFLGMAGPGPIQQETMPGPSPHPAHQPTHFLPPPTAMAGSDAPSDWPGGGQGRSGLPSNSCLLGLECEGACLALVPQLWDL
jgi:hypothetical protein